jgi:hypothetical protein
MKSTTLSSVASLALGAAAVRLSEQFDEFSYLLIDIQLENALGVHYDINADSMISYDGIYLGWAPVRHIIPSKRLQVIPAL